MSPPALNRQKKVLKFFGVSYGPKISAGAAQWEIIRLLGNPSNHEKWRRYVFLTNDVDFETDELKPFEEADLHTVDVPDGWDADAAVQGYCEELAKGVIEEQGPFDSPAPTIKI